MPFSRSVELREVNALPPTELELAITYRDRHIGADEGRLDMRVRVSFSVLELIVMGHELSEMRDEVALNIRVGVLIHEHTGGRVERRDEADPLSHL